MLCVVVTVVIWYFGGLGGDEVLLNSLGGMVRFY